MIHIKKIVFFLSLFAIMAGGCGEKKSKTAEQTLRDFYTQFITEYTADRNSDVINDIMEKFISGDLIEKLEILELDYNPFFDTKSFYTTYPDTFEIKPVAELENAYNVCYKDYFTGKLVNCVTLFLIKTDGKYLINDIDGLPDAATTAENLFISDIRPYQQLELDEIYTDEFEYVGYENGEYRDLFVLKKNNKEIRLYDNTSENEAVFLTLTPGDEVEIRWKLERFYHEGGKEYYVSEFAENVTKIDWDSFYNEKMSNELKDFKLYQLNDTIVHDLTGDSIPEKIFFNENKNIIIVDGKTGTETIFDDDDFNEFGWVGFWGITTDEETYRVLFEDDDGDGNYDISGSETVPLYYPSIVVRKRESGGGIITFNNEKYVWIHQND